MNAQQESVVNNIIWSRHISLITNTFVYIWNILLIAIVYIASDFALSTDEVSNLVIIEPFSVRNIVYSVAGILILFAIFNIIRATIINLTTTYQLTSNRLIMKHGVFTKITDQLELYRVKDYELEEPFYLRIFGIGNVKLITSDKSHPEAFLKAVKDAQDIFESLRHQVEKRRQETKTREFDS
jgi:uncharacterized membrane protein YdbT with pleckstrin-like domain